MVDWNEDGLKDLIIGEFSGRVLLYLNIGSPGNPVLTLSGYLEVDGHPILIDYDSVPFADDWDEDGRKDLLVGVMNGRIGLFINEGTNAAPIFNRTQYVTLASGAVLTVPSRAAPCVTDLDGDGFEDLVVGQISGNASYFRSIGENPTPRLQPPELLRIGGEATVNPGGMSRFAAFDWDADGLTDLIGGPQDGRIELFRQIEPGAVPAAPYLEVNFQGPAIVPDTGAVLNFTVWLENLSLDTLQLDVWADLFGPESRNWMALQEAPAILSPGAWIAHEFQWHIPATAPYGFYRAWIYAGDHQRLQFCNADTFDFQKALDLSDNIASSAHPQAPGGWEFQLSVSPNPFNPTTALQFALPEAQSVSLQIFNSAGQIIAILVSGYRDAGTHQWIWDATGLPSGIYFAKLETEKKIMIQKLLFLK